MASRFKLRADASEGRKAASNQQTLLLLHMAPSAKQCKKTRQSILTTPLWIVQIGEWLEVATGRRDRLTPPRRLLDEARIGGGDYNQVGQHFCTLFQESCGLQPHHAVLDIGCGYGRLAKPLTKFLDPEKGSYVGFDVFSKSVAWADRAFGRRHRNFKFQHLNIYNRHYNPAGVERDTTVRLPYSDGSFDFIFLTSIFTHMYRPGINHYISEISRLLRPGGKCFSTFFLLDDVAVRLIEAGKSHVKFRHTDPVEGYMALDKDDPERCIAFPVEQITPLFHANGLDMEATPRLGNWSSRQPAFDFQDVIISTKPGG